MNLLLRGLQGCLRRVPLPLYRYFGLATGFILQHVVRFRRRVVDLHLGRVYLDRGLKTPAECRRLRRGFYRHFGLLVAENLRMLAGDLAYLDRITEFEGAEHFDRALERGKGVLVLNGHIGNWELSGAVVSRHGYPLGSISKAARGWLGNRLLQRLRRNAGVKDYPKERSVRDILKGLKRNEIIVVMIDQNMTAEEGEFVPFMGYPACTLNSLAVLAARSGAAVVPGCFYRNPDGLTHRGRMRAAIELEEPYADRRQNATHNTRRFNQVLEAMIAECPEQWLWLHKRWKTRPPGETHNPFTYRRRR